MKKLLTILLLFTLLAGGCVSGGSSGGDREQAYVYRLVRPEYQTGGRLLVPQHINLSQSADPLQSAVYALASTPDDEKLMCALPMGVEILSAVKTGNVVNIYLSSSYRSLSSLEKTIVNYAVTLTVCSFSKADYVSICVGNDIVQSRLSPGDVVLENTVISSLEGQVRLYFPKNSGQGLGSEYRRLVLETDSHAERQLMEELLLGPSDSSLLSALPKDSVLLSVYTQDGLCSVSFAEGFLTADGLSYEQARLAVYSIVNSLTGLSTVDTVQILIEGKIVLQICGVDISHPLTKNIRLAGVPTA